jgi:hypothetical protein
MPFKFQVHPGHLTGLTAICDVCGSVASGDDANVLWAPGRTEQVGDQYDCLIACKDGCTRALDRRFGVHLASQGLEVGLLYLMHNAEVDLKRARQTAEVLDLLRP